MMLEKRWLTVEYGVCGVDRKMGGELTGESSKLSPLEREEKVEKVRRIQVGKM